MLQKILSILILLNILISPIAGEFQPEINTESYSIYHQKLLSLSELNDYECCTLSCINCSCSCSHLSMTTFMLRVKIYPTSHPMVKYPIATDLINNTKPPELPPPLV